MFGIGMQELILLFLFVVAIIVCRGVARRWVGVFAAFMLVSVALTPADPVSALLVVLPLSVAFSLGVLAAPYLRRFEGSPSSS